MELAEALAWTAEGFEPDRFERFCEHLDPEWIEEALLSTGKASMRRRRLPAEQTVWLVLGMGLMRDTPIAEVVDKLELSMPSPNGVVARSTVSQARKRLGDKPLEWLFLRSARQWAHASADGHRWRGLALYGVDGTSLRVPDSKENREHFGKHSGGPRGESAYPLVRMAALMALRSHLLVAASFGPFGIGELTYAEDLWQAVPDNALTILDRNFYSASLLLGLSRSGTNRHWLLRAKSNVRGRLLKRLGPGDELVELTVSSSARKKDPSLPGTFVARLIHYQRKGFRPGRLLTSLLDAKASPADEIIGLYHERWEIELGYDEIKTELLDRREAIRSQSPTGVAQELWGLLIIYNLIRLEMLRIAQQARVDPLRISFVVSLRYIRDFWWLNFPTRSPGAIPRRLGDMRARIKRFILPPRRSTRSYPRAVKIKMSNYKKKRLESPK